MRPRLPRLARSPFRLALLALFAAAPASAQTFAYVSDQVATGNVAVIDIASDSVVTTIPVGNLASGLAATPDGSRLYVGVTNSNAIQVVDTLSNNVVDTIPTPGQNPSFVAVSPDGTRVYASVSVPYEVKVIDTATNGIIATIALTGIEPHRLALTPDGSQLYVPMKSGTVEVFDTTSLGLVASIPVPGQAQAVVFSPTGNPAYVTNAPLDDVSVIDTATHTVTANIATNRNGSFDLALSPDGSRAYVTHLADSSLSVIDTTSNTLLPAIAIGASTQGIAITPDGARLYAANNVTNQLVSVVDTATSALAGTVATGLDPFDVVIATPPSSCVDSDGDSFGSPGSPACPGGSDEDCDNLDSSVFPGAPELCDGLDNDCDGLIPVDEADLDGDGFRSCENDCDDTDPARNPAAVELPGNAVHENCDGSLGACDPLATWRNHGQFVRCVAHEVNLLRDAGLLTETEGDDLVSAAAQSDVGR